MAEREAWCVFDRAGEMMIGTTRAEAGAAIEVAVVATHEYWSDLKKVGYTCRRVRIVEIAE